ncbi:hypothetical protein H3V53_41075, partial [Paraburkholderia bengalensis]
MLVVAAAARRALFLMWLRLRLRLGLRMRLRVELLTRLLLRLGLRTEFLMSLLLLRLPLRLEPGSRRRLRTPLRLLHRCLLCSSVLLARWLPLRDTATEDARGSLRRFMLRGGLTRLLTWMMLRRRLHGAELLRIPALLGHRRVLLGPDGLVLLPERRVPPLTACRLRRLLRHAVHRMAARELRRARHAIARLGRRAVLLSTSRRAATARPLRACRL